MARKKSTSPPPEEDQIPCPDGWVIHGVIPLDRLIATLPKEDPADAPENALPDTTHQDSEEHHG
jgi:hypothetical protein